MNRPRVAEWICELVEGCKVDVAWVNLDDNNDKLEKYWPDALSPQTTQGSNLLSNVAFWTFSLIKFCSSLSRSSLWLCWSSYKVKKGISWECTTKKGMTVFILTYRLFDWKEITVKHNGIYSCVKIKLIMPGNQFICNIYIWGKLWWTFRDMLTQLLYV